jgi:hypothetical protein
VVNQESASSPAGVSKSKAGKQFWLIFLFLFLIVGGFCLVVYLRLKTKEPGKIPVPALPEESPATESGDLLVPTPELKISVEGTKIYKEVNDQKKVVAIEGTVTEVDDQALTISRGGVSEEVLLSEITQVIEISEDYQEIPQGDDFDYQILINKPKVSFTPNS